ncbi:MAG: KAP family NTPase [Myxococcales bacterium]|nr:KAP family NTPase [Myxococcales bacterium]
MSASDDIPHKNHHTTSTNEREPTDVAFALSGDRPIESRTQDRLGRSPFALAIAEQILSASPHDGYVVAIMGPWGAGKTSLLNIIAEAMRERDAVVLNFNPWVFSGIEGLVSHFFRELGAQMKGLQTDRLSEIGNALEKYAGVFVPVVGYVPVVGGVAKEVASGAKALGSALAKTPSLEAQRKTIREKLTSLDTRIVVLIDDLDRLRDEEIREIVKLVRVTADFPNVVYVLAFDRFRVEVALGEDRESGRAYLEKIVQVSYDLPKAHPPDIYRLLLTEIDRALERTPHGPFHESEWADIFVHIIRPLFTTPRDVRRYVNALPPIVRVLGMEVALEDILAMEAVRMFEPEVFANLARSTGLLTGGSDGSSEEAREKMAPLVGGGGVNESVLREFFTRIFPHSARHLGGPHYGNGSLKEWRRERRIASPEVLRFYLEHRLPEGATPSAMITAVMAALGDRAELTTLLEALDDGQLESVFDRLEDYEDHFPPETVMPATGALLDQLPRLREGRQGMFDVGANLALTRVVLRLLRRIDDVDERASQVDQLLPTIKTLSAQVELLRVLECHQLAPVERVQAWRMELGRRVSQAPPESLSAERDLGALIELAMTTHPDDDEVRARLQVALDDDGVFVRFLRSGLGERMSRPMGRVAFDVQHTLPWSALVRVVGDEGRLLARISEVQASVNVDALDERAQVAIRTAVKYSDGWRPPEFGRRQADTAATPTPTASGLTRADDQTESISQPDESSREDEDPDAAVDDAGIE